MFFIDTEIRRINIVIILFTFLVPGQMLFDIIFSRLWSALPYRCILIIIVVLSVLLHLSTEIVKFIQYLNVLVGHILHCLFKHIKTVCHVEQVVHIKWKIYFHLHGMINMCLLVETIHFVFNLNFLFCFNSLV